MTNFLALKKKRGSDRTAESSEKGLGFLHTNTRKKERLQHVNPPTPINNPYDTYYCRSMPTTSLPVPPPLTLLLLLPVPHTSATVSGTPL